MMNRNALLPGFLCTHLAFEHTAHFQMVIACVKKPILDVDEPHKTTHFIILVLYETVV